MCKNYSEKISVEFSHKFCLCQNVWFSKIKLHNHGLHPKYLLAFWATVFDHFALTSYLNDKEQNNIAISDCSIREY